MNGAIAELTKDLRSLFEKYEFIDSDAKLLATTVAIDVEDFNDANGPVEE